MAVTTFELETFLPYLLNQAAEVTGREFAGKYRARYAITRTQWRAIAHLGSFGAMTAAEICRRTMEDKTRMSRAVLALEERGWLVRETLATDRRAEALRLTEAGQQIYASLSGEAQQFDTELRGRLGAQASADLIAALEHLLGRAAQR